MRRARKVAAADPYYARMLLDLQKAAYAIEAVGDEEVPPGIWITRLRFTR